MQTFFEGVHHQKRSHDYLENHLILLGNNHRLMKCLGIFQLAMFGIFGWVVPKTATNCHLSHKKTSYILSLTLVVKNSDPKIMVYERIPDYNWVAYVIPYITSTNQRPICVHLHHFTKLDRSWTHMLRWFLFLARSSP